jgi:general secretion pathway protein E
VLGIGVIPSENFPSAPVLPSISAPFLRNFKVLPISAGEESLTIAMADPCDDYAADAIALFTERKVIRVAAAGSDIGAALDHHYPIEHGDSIGADDFANEDAERLREMASDAPVVRFVNQTITAAVEARASDLHFEPGTDRLRVRVRIDGRMRDIEGPPPGMRDAVVSRLKIMAKLNIAERRLPQDGRMSLVIRGVEINFRLSTVPAIHGESVVVRVLDQRTTTLDYPSLGLDQFACDQLTEILSLPHGVVLVTGPTGSGKTTTLYAALANLNRPDRKIMTIEDPVEYQMAGINQVQVQPQIGLTFARALRAFLRQNPNIVMVGEVRDLETAQIAVQAALTGHMILSTLHTNDAPSGVTRLLDMGVEDYLLASTVNAIIAQRLVRRLCSDCRTPVLSQPGQAEGLGLEGPAMIWAPVGCPACAGTGFHGRTTILEILRMDDDLRRLVLERAPAHEIRKMAVEKGMRTMEADGRIKALAGITTFEEVLAATRDS